MFKNSDPRRKLVTTINALNKLQSKPAALVFCTSTAGIRPPTLSDQRACWDLASKLDSDAWGKQMHVFSTALEVRTNSIDDFWDAYLAYERRLEGLINHLEHVVPAMVDASSDINVTKQFARDVINKTSFIKAVPSQAERKMLFHEHFLVPLLETMKTNLATTLETASSSASHESVSKKHRVATLAALLDETTGREYCAEAHRFLSEPAAHVQAAQAAAAGGAGGGARLLNSPEYHRAVDARQKVKVASRALPPATAPMQSPNKRAHTPSGGQGGLAPAASPPGAAPELAFGQDEGEEKKQKKNKPGDAREFYLLYVAEAAKLHTGNTPNTPECMKEAYLKNGFCSQLARCSQQYGVMHKKTADKNKQYMNQFQLREADLVRIANKYIETNERLPWPVDLIRPAIARQLKPQRMG